MKRFLVPALFSLFLFSCVLNGTGQRTVSGKFVGAFPATARIGLFAPSSPYLYLHDRYADGDKDIVFTNLAGEETGTLTPVAGLVATPAPDKSYSITFPADPSTVSYLIAWDDLNSNSIIDLPAETAFLPEKSIGGKIYAVHHFASEDAVNLTYLAVYSTMTRTDPDYDLNNYAPRQDSLDALGTGAFNFNFR